MPYRLSANPTPAVLRQYREHLNKVRVGVTERLFQRRVTMRYFQRLRNDDQIHEFCVVGWNGHEPDPNMFIESAVPGRPVQRWVKREEFHPEYGTMVVFHPPDGYDGGPVGWCYDRKRHWVEAMQVGPEREYFFITGGGS